MLRNYLLILLTMIGASAVIGCAPESTQTATADSKPATTETAAETVPEPVAQATPTPPRSPDVPYVPTPDVVVERMLKLAGVKKGDIHYDLGSGDGRIVITAVSKFGALRGTGVEINPELVTQAQENAKKAGVGDRAKFVNQDLFQSDFSDATVVTLYLLPRINLKLRPQLLRQLKPGTRIVSHDFDMDDWKPDKVEVVQGPQREHTLYLWVVPKKVPPELLKEVPGIDN
ncbi:MAG: class I SAM-dependent methyltransferase [Oscillatoriales cyanobacterium SM2_2_1]|nr:class I SAM-dependent methyltransferase [Oscillatoriales cyanobacterium SM2_2_1]